MRWIYFEVCLATLGKFVVIFGFMWSTVLDTFWILSSVYKCYIPLFPTVFALGHAQVHICTTNSGNVTLYIEAYERKKHTLSLISTCSLYRELLLWISIFLWYETDDTSEWVDDSLELLMLEEADLPLVIPVFIFMSMFDGFWAIGMKRDM